MSLGKAGIALLLITELSATPAAAQGASWLDSLWPGSPEKKAAEKAEKDFVAFCPTQKDFGPDITPEKCQCIASKFINSGNVYAPDIPYYGAAMLSVINVFYEKSPRYEERDFVMRSAINEFMPSQKVDLKKFQEDFTNLLTMMGKTKPCE